MGEQPVSTLYLKIFCGVFVIALIGTMLFYIARFEKRYGLTPVTIGKARGVNLFMEQSLLVMFGLWIAILFYYSFAEKSFRQTDLIALRQTWMQVIGILFSITGLIVIAVAIPQMGEAWRIGIDEQQPQLAFVKTGLFAVLPHPIYSGVMLIATGFFLMLPNALTLALWLVSLFGTSVQMKLEEDFLISHFRQS
ncbi:MAG: hypothetical protein IAF08_12385 [Rhizobacter sp.]|nr:hypothetical protein [Chlorobiales bacterium]